MSEQPKILYAIQGTGNGHVARAQVIIPILQKYGKLEVALSGDQSEVNLPVVPDYWLSGLTFIYNKKGGISYLKTLFKNNLLNFIKEVLEFRVHDFDIIINDFESTIAWACKVRKKECFGMGHQASFQSGLCPQPPKGNVIGRFILQRYAPCRRYIGFHFERYDEFIFTPVIRQEARIATLTNKGHYTVYLPAMGQAEIIDILGIFENVQWHVFTKHTHDVVTIKNITLFPISSQGFMESFTSCTGILTSAGFETPAEALYMGKKLMVVTIKGQYEQFCNGAALAKIGVPVLTSLNHKSIDRLRHWIEYEKAIQKSFPDNTEELIYAHLIEPFYQSWRAKWVGYN